MNRLEGEGVMRMGQVEKISLVGNTVRFVFTLDTAPADAERAFLCMQIKGNPRVTKVVDCVISRDSPQVSVVIEGYLWRFPDRLKWVCGQVLERTKATSCLSEIPDIPELSSE